MSIPRIPPRVTQAIVVTMLWALAGATLLTLVFIMGFVLVPGLPRVSLEFLTQEPSRMGRAGGIGPVILGTAIVTGLAVLVAAPVGVITAVYLTQYTREGRLTHAIRFGADCLAGIPSIIYGLFGFVFFAIWMKLGISILSGSLTLALMVLPTIIRTSEEAIRAVPDSYRDASYALGSTRWQMVTRVVLRCALPGIGTGVVLSIGRCLSETAAVMLTSGMALSVPRGLGDSVRTMALHFFQLAREGDDQARANAYATAAVLLLAILVINVLAYWTMRRFVAKVR